MYLSNDRQSSRRRTSLVLGAVLALFFVPVLASAQGACEGYEKRKQLTKLGGPNSFLAEGVHSVEELQAAFESHADDVKYLLETQGMFDLIPAIFDAVAKGDVQERNLMYGETFEWMAFRSGGKARVTDGLCVKTKDEYGAFVIEVTTGGGVASTCNVSAQASCEYGNESVTVNAVGSSSGVKVMMGDQTVISDAGANTSWSGALDDPWRNAYVVKASAAGGGMGAATTYTFVIPKVCFNFAYTGKKETQVAGAGGCEESVTVSCEATAPSCSVTAAASEIQTRKPLGVEVSGQWAGDMISVEALDRDGNPVSGASFQGSSGTVSLPSAGNYAVVATATNEVGETATCRTEVEATSRWSVRFDGGPIYSDADDSSPVATPFAAASGVDRTKFVWDRGFGVEAGVTYRFNRRWGLNGTLGYSQFDSLFEADTPTEWEMDSDTIDSFSLRFGPEITLNPGRRAEVYLTPYVGYWMLGDGNYSLFSRVVEVAFDDKFGWGVALGVDIPFTSTSAWNLNFQARYTDLVVDGAADGVDLYSLDINPLALGVGVTYDF